MLVPFLILALIILFSPIVFIWLYSWSDEDTFKPMGRENIDKYYDRPGSHNTTTKNNERG